MKKEWEEEEKEEGEHHQDLIPGGIRPSDSFAHPSISSSPISYFELLLFLLVSNLHSDVEDVTDPISSDVQNVQIRGFFFFPELIILLVLTKFSLFLPLTFIHLLSFLSLPYHSVPCLAISTPTNCTFSLVTNDQCLAEELVRVECEFRREKRKASDSFIAFLFSPVLLISFTSTMRDNNWRRELVSIYASVQIIFLSYHGCDCFVSPESNMRQSLLLSLSFLLFTLSKCFLLCLFSRSENKFSFPILLKSRTNVNVLRCNVDDESCLILCPFLHLKLQFPCERKWKRLEMHQKEQRKRCQTHLLVHWKCEWVAPGVI